MSRLTFWDKTIIAFFFTLSMLGFFFNFSLESKGVQQYIMVHVDNEKVVEFSFSSQDEKTFSVPFGSDGQHEALLEVKDGKVRMLPMSTDLCPRGICSHTGWIEKDYQTIVCVPNRIVVSFQEKTINEEEVDGITY